jgi:hypothetical protein
VYLSRHREIIMGDGTDEDKGTKAEEALQANPQA